MNTDRTRRAATLALMLVTVAAGSPSFTHAHSAAGHRAVGSNHEGGAEGRGDAHGHAHHGDEERGDGARHRHVSLLGMLEVEVPATPDHSTAEQGEDPFALLDEVPLPNADDGSAKMLKYAAAVLCPKQAEPETADRSGRTCRPMLASGEPRCAVLRV